MRSGAGRRSCTYAVAIDGHVRGDDLRSFSQYLSTLGLAGCEVLIFDDSSPRQFEERRRVLRWVGRHVAVGAQYRLVSGELDLVHAAADLAGCEKVIVASAETRYSVAEVLAMCELLDRHDVVEPQEYVEPLPWWGGIDAGRLLLHRGVDQVPQGRATFAFRRPAFRPLRGFDDRPAANDTRRLVNLGAEVHEAHVFVRREPPRLPHWLALRAREASTDLVVPMKSAFFLAIVPLLVVLAAIGGAEVAGGYAGVMAFASVVLAVRGRVGAGKFFPLRACLFAPLWIFERSVTIYWALFERLLAGKVERRPSPAAVDTRGRASLH